MSDTKLCKNCKYAVIGTFVRCTHPKNMKPNLVEGGSSSRQTPEFLRDRDTYLRDGEKVQSCGPDANWYEEIAVKDIE